MDPAPASTSVPAAVTISGLTKTFSLPGVRNKTTVTAVDDLSFTVAPGEIYGLIGPNGSGKSTTMKVLLGLMAPTSGDTAIFGRDSRDFAARTDVGYLPENPYFYKHLTASETLYFYGKLCGLKRAPLRERTQELLALVDLEAARDRRLGGYSKGMLQRIALAAALIGSPRMVVLDEPTAGVDPAGSRKIRDLVISLRDRGITVFLCSHLLAQVQEVCDRIGIIARGRMVNEGTVDELLSVKDETEILLRHATPEALAAIKKSLIDHPKTELIRTGHPEASLETLFLSETNSEDSLDT